MLSLQFAEADMESLREHSVPGSGATLFGFTRLMHSLAGQPFANPTY